MGTYWEDFIKEYKTEILTVNTHTLLEAFFYYVNGHKKGMKEKCKKIMTGK